MKKCPTCDKEFPDSMRFCQTDGTVLIDDAPADPYKTVVGNQSDIASAIPPLDPFKTMVAAPPPKAGDDDILQLPEEPDNLKTMIVSQEEMKAELDSADAKDDAPLDVPSAYAPSAPLIEPKPPKPAEPSLSPPSFGDLGNAMDDEQDSVPTMVNVAPDKPKDAPPSPFDSKPNDFSTQSPYGSPDNKPIPSPFQDSMPPGYQPPSASPFDQPKMDKEPVSPFGNASESAAPPSPFDAPPSPFGQAEPYNSPMQDSGWSPPPAPVAEWGNQDLGANTPFQPPAASAGQNQTLAIVALVLSILSFLCGGILLSIPAVILAYMQKNNIKKDPVQYGGGTMATIAMVLGIINIILTVIVIVIYAMLLVSAAAR